MKRTVTIIVFLFLTFQVFSQNYKYIGTDVLNIREGAGKQFKIIGQVKRGDKVTVINDSGSWAEIETINGAKGFVASKYLTANNDIEANSKEETPWVSLLIIIGILGYAGYKIKNFFSGIFGGSSSTSQRESQSYRETTNNPDKYHLSIKNGVVNLGKERSTMRESVFNYFDKAIDCDLEDSTDDRSRFLVVTQREKLFSVNSKARAKNLYSDHSFLMEVHIKRGSQTTNHLYFKQKRVLTKAILEVPEKISCPSR